MRVMYQGVVGSSSSSIRRTVDDVPICCERGGIHACHALETLHGDLRLQLELLELCR